MPTSSKLKRLVCGILVLSACLVFWAGVVGRVRQVNFVSQLDVEQPEPDAQSFTGYKGGTRVLVVPNHRSKSMDWIVRTQKRFSGATNAAGPTNSGNEPRGVARFVSRLYGQWLATFARVYHRVSGQGTGPSVEKAAIYADAVLIFLGTLASTLVTWRLCGSWPAALVAVGFGTVYPLTNYFLPGAPDERVLRDVILLLLGVGSVCALTRFWPSRWTWRETRARNVVSVVSIFALAAAGAAAGAKGLSGAWRDPKQVPVSEVNTMLERDLARWLRNRDEDPKHIMVWAPPDVSSALEFFGGVGAIDTASSNDQDGRAAAIRIAAAGSFPEALALLRRRGVTHLVLPTWDGTLDELIASRENKEAGTFIEALREWRLPQWLRPIPYHFQRRAGIEDYAVAVFEVVDDQEEVVALCHEAEYFAEMNLLEYAATTAEELERFPRDIGALAARAQVSAARRDDAATEKIVGQLKARLAENGDRYLAWDRRVSLSLALARVRDFEGAYPHVQKCVQTLSPGRLRSLSAGALFNFEVLVKACDFQMKPELQSLTLELLPVELRQKF